MSENINDSIGAAAGKVWDCLNAIGEATISKLAEETGLDKNDVQRAIGWLAREGKLTVTLKGRFEYYGLA